MCACFFGKSVPGYSPVWHAAPTTSSCLMGWVQGFLQWSEEKAHRPTQRCCYARGYRCGAGRVTPYSPQTSGVLVRSCVCLSTMHGGRCLNASGTCTQKSAETTTTCSTVDVHTGLPAVPAVSLLTLVSSMLDSRRLVSLHWKLCKRDVYPLECGVCRHPTPLTTRTQTLLRCSVTVAFTLPRRMIHSCS